MPSIKLLVKEPNEPEWSVVCTRSYDPADMASMIEAMEKLAKDRDGWRASGQFASASAWKVNLPHGRDT